VSFGFYEAIVSLIDGKLRIDGNQFIEQLKVNEGQNDGGRFVEPDVDIESIIGKLYDKWLR
jgi:hypothetical protein